MFQYNVEGHLRGLQDVSMLITAPTPRAAMERFLRLVRTRYNRKRVYFSYIGVTKKWQ